MAFDRDGATLFVSGGPDDVVRAFAFDAATGAATPRRELAVGDPARLDLPAGLCAGADGDLFVCLQRTHAVVRLAADGTLRWTSPLPEGSFPFECALQPRGTELYVSLWARAEVLVLDAHSGAELARVPAGQHPSELLVAPDGRALFVSNANENTVTVVDLAARAATETLATALHPDAPPGSTPNALALAPDGALLLVANADNNNLAVFDVSAPRQARSLGFVPVGHYPTSVRCGRDGRVFVANGKGNLGSWPNPDGPQPDRAQQTAADYTGSMFGGSLSVFALPAPPELAALTATACRLSPLRAGAGARTEGRPADSPIPARPGDPSPIRHVVYVIKENRTYDQVFGDLPQGNGDPELCLFPREVTPNHHAIAEQFVLLDNCYVESEVSADGHEWTMGAYATDFVERTWPVTYGGKGRPSRSPAVPDEGDVPPGRLEIGYPSEGNFPIATPKNGYLWDLARAAGVSYRSYGEFVQNAADPDGPGRPRVPALAGHFDPHFRSYDVDYPDVKRAARFLEELARFEQEGELPRLIVLRLPNDHTAGTSPGKKTPRAMVADNDLALGRVLEGLSRSRFWPTLAVFVVEDDAQNGPDHVDAHRAVALVAGAHVRRGAVVSTQYSTCSMLRTIELILGLPPMSQFDAAARPMWDCFQAEPDLRPYAALPANVPLDEVNGRTAWGAERSQQFDLSVEDAADDLLFNEVIWKAVKGAGSPMPPPRRAAFVRVFDDD
jgi:sugar lactone lactonase YvrE